MKILSFLLIRLYSVYQVSLGQPSRKLEALYNTSFKQITNWVHRFEAAGVASQGFHQVSSQNWLTY